METGVLHEKKTFTFVDSRPSCQRGRLLLSPDGLSFGVVNLRAPPDTVLAAAAPGTDAIVWLTSFTISNASASIASIVIVW
jgi:hypothetical protein